jgi:hypothetical protein
VKVEADGDFHIALRDATGDKLASLFTKCQQSLSGARFAKRFSVGADAISSTHPINEKPHDERKAGRNCDWKSVLGHRPCTQRWIKPAKTTPRLRCLRDSSSYVIKGFVIRACPTFCVRITPHFPLKRISNDSALSAGHQRSEADYTLSNSYATAHRDTDRTTYG